MMPPVCVACKVQMRCVKTGIDVELMAADQPYQIWMADRFVCEGCGVQIVTQFGGKPVAEYFQQKYAAFKRGISLRFWGSMADKPTDVLPIPQILDSAEDLIERF